MLPSLLGLQSQGLATDTLMVPVGEQGVCQEPLLAHSLVLAAASPVLASLLATSRDPQVILILAGVEREEVEVVLEDLYMGRDKARVFLQKWGLWEEDDSNSGDYTDTEESKVEITTDLRPEQKPTENSSPIQELISNEEPSTMLPEIEDHLILEKALSELNKTNRCGYCSKPVKNNWFRSHIEKHMKSRLSWYKFEKQKGIRHMCDECGISFTLNITLTAHIKDTHSGKVEKCDKCDFTSIGPRHKLVIHKKMQHGLSSFICPLCDFKTCSSEELEQHKTRCNSNQKVVITPTMRHEQKRKRREALMDYTCKTCKLPFNTRQMLAIHIKADHKGIRYNCSEGNCKFSFKTRGSLNIHINNKHLGIKHRCKICDYEAGQNYKIRKHMVIKHNTETFSCNTCAYRCPDSERMQKHVLLRHHNLSVKAVYGK